MSGNLQGVLTALDLSGTPQTCTLICSYSKLVHGHSGLTSFSASCHSNLGRRILSTLTPAPVRTPKILARRCHAAAHPPELPVGLRV